MAKDINFIRRPASEAAMASRRPLYGVGINDAPWVTQPSNDGVATVCPIYRTWSGMITRCYSEDYHKRRPNHEVCKVWGPWKVFSVFAHWMEKQDWHDKILDKDLVTWKGTLYSPEHCMFVSHEVNSAIAHYSKNRPVANVGVRKVAPNSYEAKHGSLGHLGKFKTRKAAIRCYMTERACFLVRLAEKQQCKRTRQYLEYFAKNVLMEALNV